MWGSDAVARWATGAGWRGEALHDAVALAIAASGGADHYRSNPISTPGAERRGLWALRVDEVPAHVADDLWLPSVCAQVAHNLWSASDGSFAWHPVWISGAATAARPSVVAHLSGRSAPGGFGPRVPFGPMLGRMMATSEAIAHATDAGRIPGV
jgi:hypothetical protein